MSAQEDAENAAMLATLTPEEIAAINDEDAIEQEAIAKLAAASDDGADDDGDEVDESKPAENDPPPEPAKPPPAPAPAAETPPAQAPAEATPSPERKSAYRADLPADFEQKQTDLKARTEALRAQFKAGDLELDEYETQREGLDEERRKLDTLAVKADIAKEMQVQSAEELWNSAIGRQFEAAAKPEGGGIDYKADQEKLNDLDGFVKMLANNPANADKSHDWFMQNAHKRVLALHDIKPAAAPAPAPAPAAPAPSRKPPVTSIPANLANVPGSDAPGDMGGEFDQLDTLEGIELEAAISRLSPAQREKYARGG